MKAPFFWYQSPGLFSTLLQPLGWIYGKGGKILRTLKKPQRFSIPILSVGNVVCGGAGKTPTAIALATLLNQNGIKVHFVTRGYGGRQVGPLEVDPSSHTSMDVGDEPLLLAQHSPTWVAKVRPLGVQKAIENGAQLIILDDGHQTTCLHKDISFVVIDFFQSFGNNHVIPAGPLRETLKEGFKRSDAFIGIGKGELATPQPLFKARSIPDHVSFSSKRGIAFCGLGFPQKFYKTLSDLNIDLIATESFPDHHHYTQDDLLRLDKLAKEYQAILITTRKDAVKIPASWQGRIHVLDINIQFEDPEGMFNFILQKIPSLKEKM